MQQLINVLRIYKDHDECVCDPCIDPGCMDCMYSIAYTALVAIGYLDNAASVESTRDKEV